MAEAWYIEAVKFWGGIAGLGTAIFTLWDRFLRSRPSIEPFVMADPDMVRMGLRGDMGADVYFRVVNPSKLAIGLRGLSVGRAVGIDVLMHDSIHGMVSAKVGRQGVAGISPEADRLFRVYIDNDLSEGDLKRSFWVRANWRPLNALLPRLPMFMKTSAEELIALRNDSYCQAKARLEAAGRA